MFLSGMGLVVNDLITGLILMIAGFTVPQPRDLDIDIRRAA
jgi:hypothetical protein